MTRLRVGLDLASCEEVAASVVRFGSRYEQAIFTPGELADVSRPPAADAATRATRLAARFAAKEATIKALAPVISGAVQLGTDPAGFTVTLSYLQMLVVGLTFVLMAIFTFVIARTDLGRAQRAVAQDKTMAALLGIDVDRTIAITFVIGAGLAATAGLMAAIFYGVIDFTLGFLAGIKAFTAAVLGGIGSLPGAMLGGLLLGIIESLWSAYLSAEYRDVASFAILIAVLIVRPSGLLGQKEIEKV